MYTSSCMNMYACMYACVHHLADLAFASIAHHPCPQNRRLESTPTKFRRLKRTHCIFTLNAHSTHLCPCSQPTSSPLPPTLTTPLPSLAPALPCSSLALPPPISSHAPHHSHAFPYTSSSPHSPVPCPPSLLPSSPALPFSSPSLAPSPHLFTWPALPLLLSRSPTHNSLSSLIPPPPWALPFPLLQ